MTKRRDRIQYFVKKKIDHNPAPKSVRWWLFKKRAVKSCAGRKKIKQIVNPFRDLSILRSRKSMGLSLGSIDTVYGRRKTWMITVRWRRKFETESLRTPDGIVDLLYGFFEFLCSSIKIKCVLIVWFILHF